MPTLRAKVTVLVFIFFIQIKELFHFLGTRSINDLEHKLVLKPKTQASRTNLQLQFDFTGLGYNCLNTGYDCKNGGACDYFGRCKCPPGYTEVDCGLDTGERHAKMWT